jgi:tRNA-specific 2-thiouridylase
MERKVYLLFSGGLDSILAAKLLKNLGYEVVGVYVSSPFFSKDLNELKNLAEKLGIELKVIEAREDYLEMLKNPVYGYGKNLNPCIDCKAYMLKKVKEIAGENGIIATGEVLGQRPMSQHLQAFRQIEKLSGLKGKILRPLSGKLLPETEYEKKGLVDRNKLLDLKGRSRKRYPDLLKKLGVEIENLPTPSGGCLLTDPTFSKKVKDLIEHGELSWGNVKLLKIGRHFRINGCKLIVGRNRVENEALKNISEESDFLLKVPQVPSPVGVLRCKEKVSEELLKTAGGIVARYSDAKNLPEVKVTVYKSGKLIKEIVVKPIFETDKFKVV